MDVLYQVAVIFKIPKATPKWKRSRFANMYEDPINLTIDALDEYKPDWRGYIVKPYRGAVNEQAD